MSNQAVNYQCVLADLRTRRDLLNHAIAAVEQIVGEAESPVLVRPEELLEQRRGQSVASVAPASTVYRTMTLGDAAVHFLRSRGRPQSTGAIVRALRSGGTSSKSKNLYTTAYNTLTDRAKRANPTLVRMGTLWGLAEWRSEQAMSQNNG